MRTFLPPSIALNRRVSVTRPSAGSARAG